MRKKEMKLSSPGKQSASLHDHNCTIATPLQHKKYRQSSHISRSKIKKRKKEEETTFTQTMGQKLRLSPLLRYKSSDFSGFWPKPSVYSDIELQLNMCIYTGCPHHYQGGQHAVGTSSRQICFQLQ